MCRLICPAVCLYLLSGDRVGHAAAPLSFHLNFHHWSSLCHTFVTPYSLSPLLQPPSHHGRRPPQSRPNIKPTYWQQSSCLPQPLIWPPPPAAQGKWPPWTAR